MSYLYSKLQKQERKRKREENQFNGDYGTYTTPTGIVRVKTLHPTKGYRTRNVGIVAKKPEENGFFKMLFNFFRK